MSLIVKLWILSAYVTDYKETSNNNEKSEMVVASMRNVMEVDLHCHQNQLDI